MHVLSNRDDSKGQSNLPVILSSCNKIPLSNTFTLITSGFCITLLPTILIGLYFSIIQIFEYKNAYFCNLWIIQFFFFLSTGFHGIYVLIGTFILIISLIRIYYFHFSLIHRTNSELSI
ncbi:hypothetical protein E2986_12461 [Frieseomelitta varia]|uniref:Cytochrome c oxidase subunit 3 n=1 Tax=Frieseomelitta varia TaxID=561572 RepID=A0A833RXS9_9HYME|nr:hypothetical protein E2986_12461 [Frieseomelitta varia]